MEPEAWVVPNGRTRPGPGLFVAGSRQGRVVLQHRDIADPDHGGQYTVKVYESTKVPDGEGGWRHAEIRLKPDTDASGYEPITLRAGDGGDMWVIAELAEVLGVR